MPINVKRSVNYTNQTLKIKNLGLGGLMRLYAEPVVLQEISPYPRAYFKTAMTYPFSQDDLMLYGGIDLPGGTFENVDIATKSYLLDPATEEWTHEIDSPPTEGYQRLIAECGTTSDGKFMVAGGLIQTTIAGGGIFDGATITPNSRTYDPLTDTWSSPSLLPFGADEAPTSTFWSKAIATDYVTEKTFLYSNYVYKESLAESQTKRSLCVWDGSSWAEIDGNSPVYPFTEDPTNEDDYLFTHEINLAARSYGKDPAMSMVLVYTSSYANVEGGLIYSSMLARWTQTGTSPIVGTWDFVTGTFDQYNTEEPMPFAPCGLMWEANRSRWTAISYAPDLTGLFLGANLWTSEDNGETWTPHLFDTGEAGIGKDGYESVGLSGEAQIFFKPQIEPDPANNRFYFTRNNFSGGVGSPLILDIYQFDIASNPSDSTVQVVYRGSPP